MSEFIDYKGEGVPVLMYNTKTDQVVLETTIQKLLPGAIEICKDSK